MFWPLTSCSLTVCRRTVFFHLLKNPYFIKAYTLWMFSFYTQATCTILFQKHANQLICSSVFSRLSLFGTKRNANTLFRSSFATEPHAVQNIVSSKNGGLSSDQCVTVTVIVTRRTISDWNNNRWPTADRLVFFVLPWQLWATVSKEVRAPG